MDGGDRRTEGAGGRRGDAEERGEERRMGWVMVESFLVVNFKRFGSLMVMVRIFFMVGFKTFDGDGA